MKMIVFIIVSCLGVVSGVSLYREGAFTPAPPGARPTCATKSATFCEKVDKYPTKVIQRLLSSKSFLMDDFFTDESEGLDEPPEYILHEDMMAFPEKSKEGRKTRSLPADIANSSSANLSKKCPILSKAALPKMAANSLGEWRFIVQDDQSKTNQKIRVHLCDKSEECSMYCMQFYAPVPMVYLDHTGMPNKDTFWMPSSCRCNSQPINTL